MDLKKVQTQSAPLVKPELKSKQEVGNGPSFESLLNPQVTNAPNGAPVSNLTGANLAGVAPTGANVNPIKFSGHAIERMMSRGIQFNQTDLQKLSDAVDRAASKGSKDSLILMNDSALIVSIKNKTVVTVMDKSALKENVFTNIDSTIVM